MADRELRHMRRTELVEIIFALKQSEDQLKAENADLTANWNSADPSDKSWVHCTGRSGTMCLRLRRQPPTTIPVSVRSVDRDALQAQAKAEADQIRHRPGPREQLKAQTKRECDAPTDKRAQTEADQPPCGLKRNRRLQHGGLL